MFQIKKWKLIVLDKHGDVIIALSAPHVEQGRWSFDLCHYLITGSPGLYSYTTDKVFAILYLAKMQVI